MAIAENSVILVIDFCLKFGKNEGKNVQGLDTKSPHIAPD
jgi:hypothetical protein